MTDHLASAITGAPAARPRVGVVAAIGRQSGDGADIATQVQAGEQQIYVIDECVNWRHEVGDPVALEWGADNTCYVVRPLVRRPHYGTVTKVEAFSNTVNCNFTDDTGAAWRGNVVGTTPAVGDRVEVMWTVQGAMCVKALWWTEGPHPDMTTPWRVAPPAIQTSGLPDVVPTQPDPRFEATVQAVQSGSIRDGAWRADGAADRLIQGAQTSLEPVSAGAWLYSGGLDFLAGRVITAATLDLRRLDTGSRAAQVMLRLHSGQTTAGTPAWVGEAMPGPVLRPGEQASFDLPPATLAPLTTGAAHGIGIAGTDWCEIAGVGATVTSGRLHITSRIGDDVTVGTIEDV